MARRSILTIFLILVLLAVAAPGVMANQVQVGFIGSPYGPYQTGSGGEFSLTPLGSFSWVLGGYSSDAKYGTAFQSFCLEGNENIDPYSAKYEVTLSDRAIYGGQTGAVGAGDPLSKGTTWLYSNFATHGNFDGLATYDYTNPGRSGTGGSADKFQKAVWWLEGELGQTYNAANAFEAAVVAKFGSEAAAKANAAPGEYGVWALNMWAEGHLNDPSYRRQDQLVFVPEPFTLLFLGSCLLGVGLVSRKFKA